jgi:hypothetical protein
MNQKGAARLFMLPPPIICNGAYFCFHYDNFLIHFYYKHILHKAATDKRRLPIFHSGNFRVSCNCLILSAGWPPDIRDIPDIPDIIDANEGGSPVL